MRKKYPEQKFPSGVYDDTRPEELKLKDFRTEEVFSMAAPVIWPDKTLWDVNADNQKMLSTFEIQNQDGSYSCLSQAGALVLAINNYQEEGKYRRISARPIYANRRNKPDKGMWVDDLGELLKKGSLFEVLVPSDGVGEDAMNALDDYLPSFDLVKNIYKAKSYLWIPNNIDSVASILVTGKPVIICLKFGDGEWAMEVPTINPALTPDQVKYGHGITALPNAFFMYNGKKAILIQDSWGIKSGNNGRRILTEDWFNKGRVSAAIWTQDLNNLATQNGSMQKPIYNFTKNLIPGMRGDDVAMLQRCLGYLKDNEGYLFPLNTVPTAYYGGITRNAVKRFQVLSSLLPTGNVDDLTRSKLNESFRA